jgi:hypothetical protein
MATPAQIRDATTAQLEQTFSDMTSPEFLLDLIGEPPEQKTEAATRLMQVAHARLALANAAITDIQDKLAANEQDLNKGITSMKNALADLNAIASVLTAVAGFLDTIAKIIPLVM